MLGKFSKYSAFFESCGELQQTALLLHEKIIENAPNLGVEIFEGMGSVSLAYGVMPYKSKSGSGGVWPLIALAPRKNYFSLYICAVKDGQYYAEIYRDKLGKVSCGRSCIRFKKPNDINIEAVGEIVKEISKRISKGEQLFGI